MPQPIPRPRAILVDLFDTLVHLTSRDSGVPMTWEDLGIPLDAYRRRWFQNHDGRATGRIRDHVEVLRVVVHDIDPTIPVEKIAWAAGRRLRRFEHALLHVEARTLAAVAKLRAAGVRLALVSNVCGGEFEAWPRSPLAPHFDAALFSCEVGVAKPDRAIYDEALARLGVSATEALFVGDGGSDELRGAREAALSTVLVTRLAGDEWAHTLEERRRHADFEFEDVPQFVEALAL